MAPSKPPSKPPIPSLAISDLPAALPSSSQSALPDIQTPSTADSSKNGKRLSFRGLVPNALTNFPSKLTLPSPRIRKGGNRSGPVSGKARQIGRKVKPKNLRNVASMATIRSDIFSTIDTSKPPIANLVVIVAAARNLVAKDRNGFSDPFVNIKFGLAKSQSPVINKSLNPVWSEPLNSATPAVTSTPLTNRVASYNHTAKLVIPIWESIEFLERERIELVFWDRDLLSRKDYLGEISFGLDSWFGRGQEETTEGLLPVGLLNPKNAPFWAPLYSTRSKTKNTVSGDVLIQIGLVPASPNAPKPESIEKSFPLDLQSFPPDQETQLAKFFKQALDESIDRRASKGDRAIFHPPEQSFGTLRGEMNGAELSKGIGMGQPGDSSSSDSSSDEEDEDESELESDTGGEIPDLTEQLDEYFTKTPTQEPKVLVSSDTQPVPSRKLPLPGFMRRTNTKTTLPTITTAVDSEAGLETPSSTSPLPSGATSPLPSGATTPSTEKKRLKFVPHRKKSGSEPTGDESKRPLRKRKSRKNRSGGYTFQTGRDDDVLGLVFLEVKRAEDLPRYKNMTRTGFDMDPFVIISFGHKIFRTRVIRHSLNPTWDEKLFFHVKRGESKFQICHNLFDWDKLTSNDSIGEAKLDLAELLSRATKPDLETGLFPVDGKGLVGDEFSDFILPLAIRGDMEKASPKLKIRAKFTPYEALRQQFWRVWIKQYDVDNSGTISYVELFSLLDALGSTLSKKTITSFFTRFGKTENDALTVGELIICLEQQIAKPNSEKRKLDEGLESGLQTPDVNTPVSLRGVGDSPQFRKTQLDYIGERLSHVSEVEELKDSQPLDTSNAVSAVDDLEPPRWPAQRQDSTSSSSYEGLSSSSDDNDDSIERVINIKYCPLCQKPRLNTKGELDIVTHLAICASQDWNTVDKIMVGNFVTASQAQRKWFTKVISKVSSGSYRLGANNANIIVQDRLTGQLLEEKMQVYVRLGIRLLYKGLGSNRMEGARIRKMLESMSIKQGIKYDDPESAKEIEGFIAFHNLNLDEIRDPLPSFKTFNEFFYRKLKEDARPVDNPDDPNILVSGADCRCMVFPTINEATNIWIKGREFTLPRLFGDQFKEDAKKFEGGGLVIFRLAPQDYHRYHSPVDGTVGPQVKIAGQYYTVNPMAIRSAIDVYGENVRLVMPIYSPQFGQVMVCHIGAMMVGSICMTAKEGDKIKRGDETGYFAFGGSTIVVVFERNTVQFDDDLVNNSRQCLETLVRVGMKIGRRV